ncbi:MAG: AAA family ATPase [Nocardiopsaceae bacterium]|nr:AAA family ATPase [Nocardiopsaceae bacterium]
MTGFVGRRAELALLRRRLDRVTATGAGTALVIRGRRQVGKSRLAQEFCDRAGVPYVFFTATKGASAAAALIRRRWASWRGRAVEPVIREALSIAADDLPWPEATAVGAWWNRAFDPEIDLIGADRAPVARQLYYAGDPGPSAIRWQVADIIGAFT